MRLVILLLAALATASPDDFTVVRTVTVNFGKDKSEVSRSQKEQLRQLIAQAQGLQGYMISVAAYAPPPGSEPVNQKLSMQRASAITAILRQAGVPLANVIVTAAMAGPSPASPEPTSKEQAGDRRVVVTLLQVS
jgi:outer membrane protein OmpA-like peptidoglycan-associated protein